ERMTEAHKQLLALQQRISDLDGKKLTADEKSVLARKDELIQALTLLDVKQQELQKQSKRRLSTVWQILKFLRE
ncbi:phage tail tape measure protein, partial [Salmonella enterica subsp. enterica serovar Enteritidis]|nr:phage tail tape measure protein [Salmonella enterica subsp. enterica serovar Enteritidis]